MSAWITTHSHGEHFAIGGLSSFAMQVRTHSAGYSPFYANVQFSERSQSMGGHSLWAGPVRIRRQDLAWIWSRTIVVLCTCWKHLVPLVSDRSIIPVYLFFCFILKFWPATARTTMANSAEGGGPVYIFPAITAPRPTSVHDLFRKIYNF
jgi:hypothetical protein